MVHFRVFFFLLKQNYCHRVLNVGCFHYCGSWRWYLFPIDASTAKFKKSCCFFILRVLAILMRQVVCIFRVFFHLSHSLPLSTNANHSQTLINWKDINFNISSVHPKIYFIWCVHFLSACRMDTILFLGEWENNVHCDRVRMLINMCTCLTFMMSVYPEISFYRRLSTGWVGVSVYVALCECKGVVRALSFIPRHRDKKKTLFGQCIFQVTPIHHLWPPRNNKDVENVKCPLPHEKRSSKKSKGGHSLFVTPHIHTHSRVHKQFVEHLAQYNHRTILSIWQVFCSMHLKIDHVKQIHHVNEDEGKKTLVILRTNFSFLFIYGWKQTVNFTNFS